MKKRILLGNFYWLLIIGLVGYILYFWIFARYDDLSNMKLQVNKEQLQERIAGLAEKIGLDLEELKPEFSLRRNNELVQFLQKRYGLRKTAVFMQEHIPAYYWHAEYTSPGTKVDTTGEKVITLNVEDEKKFLRRRGQRTLIFDISSTGEWLGFEKIFPPDTNKIVASPRREDAERFLSYLGPELHSHWIFREAREQKFRHGILTRFRWINQEIDWGDSVLAELDFRGTELRRYRLSFGIQPQKKGGLDEEEIQAIWSALLILIMVIVVLIHFIRRLRQDKIDFKNSWIIALLVALAMMMIMLPNVLGDSFLTIFMALLFSAPFVGGAGFILSAVSESVARDVWNEKLFTYDLLCNGTFRSPRVGRSLLTGLAFAGIVLGGMALFLVSADLISPLWFNYKEGVIHNLVFRFPFIYNIGSGLLVSIFLFLAVAMFGFTYLKQFSKSVPLHILLALLLVLLFPFKLLNIHPVHWEILSHIVPGIFLIIILLQYDFLATAVAFISVFSFVGATPYLNQGATLYVFQGGVSLIFPILFFLGGVFGIRGRELVEETEFVPDYLKRFRERERFQRELEIARNVQLQFLPRTKPRIKWLDVASNCTPAYEVGGDYYDFLELDKNRFGVVVGDVSGKGVSAAFYMTLMKGILKSQTRHGDSPGEVLMQINDLFYENAQRGVFISMIYGVFDRKKRTFSFARAGHNPIISLLREKNQVREISSNGIAIGLDKGPIFNRSLQEVTMNLNAGDIFLFYTDGYSEAMDEKRNEFGEKRLLEIIKKNSDWNAAAILRQIQREIADFTGKTPQHDDMTMVIVRVCE